MSFCKVYGCRFPTTHITFIHECGKCDKQGHGQVECGNQNSIDALALYDITIPFEQQCCVLNCNSISTHTVDGHKCTLCKSFGHDETECAIKMWQIMDESGTTFRRSKDGFMEEMSLKLEARKHFGWAEHKVYTKIYGGMGCTWFARRNNNFENIELFFMHSDNWGQYGPATDVRPKLDKFLEGYRCIDKE